MLTDDERTALVDELADIEHQRWSDWQAWCHKVLRENCPSRELEAVLERWDRQIATPYAELTEREKQSDREQVERYMPIIDHLLAAHDLDAAGHREAYDKGVAAGYIAGLDSARKHIAVMKKPLDMYQISREIGKEIRDYKRTVAQAHGRGEGDGEMTQSQWDEHTQ